MKPGGIALLPVPIIGPKTVEYPAPNPHEHDHVRCPGADYYDRYRSVFAAVRIFRSGDFDPTHQLDVYEDRTPIPATIPLRPRVPGSRHEDVIGVGYK